MHTNEQTEFNLMLHQNAELYGKTLSSALANIYWEDLKDYSLKDVWNAFKLHRKDEKAGKYLPKPIDLMRYLKNKQPVAKVAGGKCSAEYRSRRCPVAAKHVEHGNGWCDYHFPIRQKVLAESSYCVLEDKILVTLLDERSLNFEKYHWERMRQQAEKLKTNTVEAAKKALPVSDKKSEDLKPIKDILAKQNPLYGNLDNRTALGD
jgi:hypothetical protein